MQCKSNVNKSNLVFVLVKFHNFREIFVCTPSHSTLMCWFTNCITWCCEMSHRLAFTCLVFTAPDAISLLMC